MDRTREKNQRDISWVLKNEKVIVKLVSNEGKQFFRRTWNFAPAKYIYRPTDEYCSNNSLFTDTTAVTILSSLILYCSNNSLFTDTTTQYDIQLF